MFQIAACAKWGVGYPDWCTLTLSVNDRPVSPWITQCLVSDRSIPSVVIAQSDVMLILKLTVLRDSVASTARRCFQNDPDFLWSQGRKRKEKDRQSLSLRWMLHDVSGWLKYLASLQF